MLKQLDENQLSALTEIRQDSETLRKSAEKLQNDTEDLRKKVATIIPAIIDLIPTDFEMTLRKVTQKEFKETVMTALIYSSCEWTVRLDRGFTPNDLSRELLPLKNAWRKIVKITIQKSKTKNQVIVRFESISKTPEE